MLEQNFNLKIKNIFTINLRINEIAFFLFYFQRRIFQ